MKILRYKEWRLAESPTAVVEVEAYDAAADTVRLVGQGADEKPFPRAWFEQALVPVEEEARG